MADYDENSKETHSSSVLLPMSLTMSNWITFQPIFENACMAKDPEDIGVLILTGVEMEEPTLEIHHGAQGEERNQIYKDFEKRQGMWNKYKKSKRELCSLLYVSMSLELRTKCDNVPTLKDRRARGDLLFFWHTVEELCVGRGGVSIYTTIQNLLKLRCKPKQFSAYSNRFVYLANQLSSLGTPEQIWTKVKNAIFIMGLEGIPEFEHHLEHNVKVLEEWPSYETLQRTIQRLEDNVYRKELLDKDNRIEANRTNTDGTDISCYNCGDKDHTSRDCPWPKHKCLQCNKFGHLERFHDRIMSYNRDSPMKPKTSSFRSQLNRSGWKGKPRPTSSPQKPEKGSRFQKKTRSYLTSLAEVASAGDAAHINLAYLESRLLDSFADEDILEIDINQLYYYDVEERSQHREDEDEAAAAQVAMFDELYSDFTDTVHDVNPLHIDITDIKESEYRCLAAKTDDDEFVVDNGCIGAHVFKTDRNLDSITLNPKIRVTGFTGPSYYPEAIGYVNSSNERAIVMPKANSNLLSVSEFLKDGGSYKGDRNKITFYKDNGSIRLIARNRGDGYLTFTYQDLVAAYEIDKSVSNKHNLYRNIQVAAKEDEPFYSNEEKTRAKEARELHARLNHPNDAALIKALDNGAFKYCHLSSQAVRDALVLFGPCTWCLIGKMKPPPEKTSISPPPSHIGGNVHVDLIILTATSLGGNNYMLFAVDGKCRFKLGIPAQSKTTKNLCGAFDKMISIYNRHGHRVHHITSDDEKVFRSCVHHLGIKGITLSHTPAGLHEKFAESALSGIKGKFKATAASLPYSLPSVLECEAYISVITTSNMLPSSMTGTRTPHEIFTHQKPTLPAYTFGTIGFFYHKRQDLKYERAELGIFISHGMHQRYLKAYLPLRLGVYSMRKVVVIPGTKPPPEWKFNPNMDQSRKTIAPNINNHEEITQETTTFQPNVDIQTGLNTLPSPTEPEDLTDTNANPSIPSNPINQNPSHFHSSTLQTPLVENMDSLQPIQDDTTPFPPQTNSSIPQPDNNIISPSFHQEGVQANTEANQEGALSHVMEPTAVLSENPTRKSSRNPKLNYRNAPPPKFRDEVRKSGIKQVKVLNILSTTSVYDLPSYVSAFRLSLKQAMAQSSRKDAILASIYKEIENLEAPDIMTCIKYQDIPQEYLKHVILVWLFYKEKYKSDGTFDKDKCRIVALSHLRDPDTIGETFSPTVNGISVFIMLQISANDDHKRKLSAYDIKGAFLKTPIGKEFHYYIKVPPDLAKYWILRFPHRAIMISEDGCLYFKLNNWLYGFHESPHFFNSMLDKDLKNLGFNPTESDKCLYIKHTINGIIYLSLHVDDMLLSFPDIKYRAWFESEMSKKTYELSPQHDELSYLGMTIKVNIDGSIVVNQRGYLQSILNRYLSPEVKTFATSPADDNLNDNTESDKYDNKKYLSLVMSLMYLARLTRPDILMPTTYLASRCAGPNIKDYQKLLRIVSYLGGTVTTSMVFQRTGKINPVIYADASHQYHLNDSKGHGGIIITLGSAPIMTKSYKLKLVTRSSTESELVVLEEAVTFAIWIKKLLKELQVFDGPITIYQDNKSTMSIALKGGSFTRTKHLFNRQNFVKQHQDSGDINLLHLRSELMPADMETKPLGRYQIRYFLRILSFDKL